jgi:PKD repeat protein
MRAFERQLLNERVQRADSFSWDFGNGSSNAATENAAEQSL